MEETQRTRSIVILFITGMVVTVIIAILYLIYLWSPKEKKEEKYEPTEVGQFAIEKVTEDDKVKAYFGEISAPLMNGSTLDIYNHLSESYKSYTNITESLLEYKLEQVGLINDLISMKKYQSYDLKGYSRVHILNLSKANSKNTIDMIILEKSPNNYTISFDDLIEFDNKNIKTETKDSIKVTVSNLTKLTSKYRFKLEIKNESDDTVVLNSKEAYESVYLLKTDNTLVDITNTVFTGRKISLRANEKRTYDVEFLIPYMSFDEISSLVIKDVLFEKSNKTIDIEYNVI